MLINNFGWTYVQENADGFCVNFIEKYAFLTQDELVGFFRLFKNTVTSFESDANLDYQPLERDKLATVVFHSAG